MARVLVTGSADGLGFLAGERLLREGHQVILHARSEERARATPAGAEFVIGDVATIASMKAVAAQVGALGGVDAVIHNVGIRDRSGVRRETADGLEQHFAVNTLAPYVLTALIPAKRLVYLTSALHHRAQTDLADPQWTQREWSESNAYADTKLHDVWLAFGIARRWPDVRSNAVEPGWVPTKMGGPEAPDDLELGADTQAWLAVSSDAEASTSGAYFVHRKTRPAHPAAYDPKLQDALFELCAELSGVSLP